jgi:hypothetical protein
MRRRLEQLGRFWFGPTDPRPIAAFRILLGVYLFVYLGQMAPHVSALFSNAGVYAPYMVPDYAPSPTVAALLMGATLALAAAFTAGFRTRVVTPLLLLGFLYHYFIQLAVKHSSFERLVVIYLMVLCLVDSGRVWSLDARASRSSGQPIEVWAERVIRFQTIMLYFGAGLWKAFNPRWHSGELLFTTLQGLWATPVGFWLAGLDLGEGAWRAATWVVICGEMSIGIALAFRRTWMLGVVAAVLFHLANTFILFIPEFLVCLAPLVLFVRPERLAGLAGRR